MPVEIRAIGPAEVDALEAADVLGFGGTPPKADASRSWSNGELDRTRVAFEGGDMVGVSRTYSFDLTMPGGAFVPTAAVSWVSVLPTHRRRGVLTQMMAAMHDDARERDEPAAILTASESSIYGRFGYGVATWRVSVGVERSRISFRAPGDEVGRVRILARDDAMRELPAIYERMRPGRPGMVSRPGFWWPQVYWEHFFAPDKAVFAAVHADASGTPDGYATYELSQEWAGGFGDRTLSVFDLQAASPAARLALWRFLFDVDLVRTVKANMLPVDDPLRHAVADGRRVRVEYVHDGLWLAPLDPAALLAARTYAIPGRLVVAVHAPDGTETTLAIDGDPNGAECKPSVAEPDLTCSSAVLGACLLGGTRWSELAGAGLVGASDPRALLRADAMFLTNPAPALLSYF